MSSIDKDTTGTPSSSSVNQRTTRGLIHRATNDGPAIAYCEQVVINVSYNYPPPSNVDHELKSTGAQEPPQAVRDAPIPEKPAQNGACAPSHNWASSTPGTSTELATSFRLTLTEATETDVASLPLPPEVQKEVFSRIMQQTFPLSEHSPRPPSTTSSIPSPSATGIPAEPIALDNMSPAMRDHLISLRGSQEGLSDDLRKFQLVFSSDGRNLALLLREFESDLQRLSPGMRQHLNQLIKQNFRSSGCQQGA